MSAAISYLNVSHSAHAASNSTSAAARTPPELLLGIFQFLRLGIVEAEPPYVDLSLVIVDRQRVQQTLASSCQVCRAWRGAATTVLYHAAAISTQDSVDLFLKTLELTSYGEYVRSLRFSGFLTKGGSVFPWHWPSFLLNTVREKCSNLTSLSINLPAQRIEGPIFPCAPDFTKLRYLSFGPSSSDPALWLAFANSAGMVDLPNLEELLLGGAGPHAKTEYVYTWPTMTRLRLLTLKNMMMPQVAFSQLFRTVGHSLEEVIFIGFSTVIPEGAFVHVAWPSLPSLRRLTLSAPSTFVLEFSRLVESASQTLEEITIVDLSATPRPLPFLPRLCRLAVGTTPQQRTWNTDYFALLGSITPRSAPSLRELHLRGTTLGVETESVGRLLHLFSDTLESVELLDSTFDTQEFSRVLRQMQHVHTLKLHIPHDMHESMTRSFFLHLPPRLRTIHLWPPRQGAGSAATMAFFDVNSHRPCPYLKAVYWAGPMLDDDEDEAKTWCSVRGIAFRRYEADLFCDCFNSHKWHQVVRKERQEHFQCVLFP